MVGERRALHRLVGLVPLIGLGLALANGASATPPTASYAPAPDSYLGTTDTCAGATSQSASFELDFASGGNCTSGSPCNITVTSGANGSGTGIADQKFIGCSVQTLTGTTGAVTAQVGTSGTIVFIGSTPDSESIAVSCSPSGANTTARICCEESGTDNLRPFFDVNCPLPTASQPEFGSSPTGGAVIALSAQVGSFDTETLTVSNTGPGTLTVTAGGVSAPITVSPTGQQSVAPTSGTLNFTLTCTPTQTGTVQQTLSLATNDSDEGDVTYTATCTGTAPPAPAAPELVASPPEPGPLTIVTTQPSQGSTTFTLQNTGDANLVISAITGASSPFSVTPASATITPGGSAVFNVLCDGSSAGPFSDTFSVFTNDTDDGEDQVDFNVNCTVNAQAVPEFDSSPAAPGPLSMATTQPTDTTTALVVTNLGNADLQVASASVISGDTSVLSVSPSAAVIPQQSQNTFTVSCDGAAIGSYSGILRLVTTDADEQVVDYTVSCGVQAAPEPEFDSTPAAGSTLSMSTTQGVDATTTVAVSNLGNQTLSVLSASGLSSPFSVSPTSASIAAGASRTFTITCSGAAAGSFNNGGTPLSMSTNDTSEPTVLFPVSCSVAAPVVPEYASTPAAPGPLTINTTFGTDATATLNVSNSGTGTLSVTGVTGLASPFSVSPTAGSIAPGGNLNFFVTCSGATAGSFDNGGAQLVVATNDTSEASVAYTVSCNVVALPPEFNATPAPLAATIDLETSIGIAVTSSITVDNVGPAGAGALDLATSGLSAPLSVSPTTAAIARNASATLTITCLPTVAGTVTQTLTIGNDDDDENPALYTVRCRAFAPEYASVPVDDATVVIDVDRGETGTGSVRITNPTTGGGSLQYSTSGLSGVLSVAPATATIDPPQIPPTVSYAPVAGTTVTATGGATSIVATSNADGSGSTSTASTTTVESCTITGAGAGAFGTVVLTPDPLAFVSRTAGSGTIGVTCTRAVSAANATLTCSEKPGVNAAVPRAWPLVCPAL